MKGSKKVQKSIEDYAEILERFNGKLEELSKYPEFTTPNETGVRIHILREEFERHGPEARFINAVLLPLRFFLHDNEDTNLYRMKEMYKEMPISEETKDEFYKIRRKIDSFLNSGSGVKIFYGSNSEEVACLGFCDDVKGGDSKRVILDLFRNGYYEHMNASKNSKKPRQPKLLASIKEIEYAYVIMEQINLIKILKGLIQYCLEIKKINDKAISELRAIS